MTSVIPELCSNVLLFSLVYSYYGRDTISIVPVIAGGPMLWTSNLSVMRQIVGGGSQSDWQKPVRVSRALM